MGRVSDLLKSWPCGFVGDELVDNQRLDLKEAMDCRWDILREHRKRFEAIPHPQQELPLAGTRKVGNMGVLWHSRNNDARKIIPQDDLGAFVQCMTIGDQPASAPKFSQLVKAKHGAISNPSEVMQELAQNKRSQAIYQAAQLVKSELRLCTVNGQLCVYSAPLWKPVDQHAFYTIVRERCREGESLYSRMTSGDQAALIRTLLEDAGLQCTQDDLEPDPGFICISDGIYDIDRGIVLEASSKYFFTSALPISTADIKNPVNHGVFDNFLANCTDGLPQVRKRLLEVMGTILCGSMPRNFYVLQGGTSTGKSVVGDLIRGVLLGESVCLALNSPTQLRENHISGSMVDKRLIFCMDLPDGRFDPATVGILKQMTGDPNNMTANRKHVQQQSFKSRCKILFSSNFIVQLKGGRQDEAFFDRMICVPFFNSVPKDARDINLLEKLKLEKGYIFQQAMAALRDLRGRNFVFTESDQQVLDAACSKSKISTLQENKEAAVRAFVSGCCRIAAGEEILFADLHGAYALFCAQKGYAPFANSAFGSKLRELYPELGDARRCMNGRQHRFVTGICLTQAGENAHIPELA